MRLISVVLTSWISSITSKICWIISWPWSNHVCVSVRLCLSVIDSTNWYMGCKNKYWYFLSGNLDFGLDKSWQNHGTFFRDFCGNPVNIQILWVLVMHIVPLKWVNISSENGWVPSRCQAISWIEVDPYLQCHMASLHPNYVIID